MKSFIGLIIGFIVTFCAYCVFTYNPQKGYHELVNNEFRETALFTSQIIPFICDDEVETFIRISVNNSPSQQLQSKYESERDFIISKEDDVIELIENLRYYNVHQERLVFDLKEAINQSSTDSLKKLKVISEILFDEMGPDNLLDWIKDDINVRDMSEVKSFRYFLLIGPSDENFISRDANYIYDAYIDVVNQNSDILNNVDTDCIVRYREIIKSIIKDF